MSSAQLLPSSQVEAPAAIAEQRKSREWSGQASEIKVMPRLAVMPHAFVDGAAPLTKRTAPSLDAQYRRQLGSTGLTAEAKRQIEDADFWINRWVRTGS